MSTEPLDPAMVNPSPLFDEADFDKTIITSMPGNLFSGSDGLFLKSHDSSYRLPLGAMVIGRDASCTLSLPSRMISRHHAVIYRQGKHYLLRDLHSTNGVSVNDKPVAQTLLRPGDRITMGDQHFEITEGQHPPEKYNTACIVVFLDLANSTRLTEKYGKAFSEHIRHMMRLLEDQVLVQRGCPVKQLGDGLMCAFDLWHVKEADYQAFDKSLQFAQKAVRMFSEDRKYERLSLRVGLHYGDIVLSETPHFDLFGDTVNTAARIEAANKYYGTQIMVSDAFLTHTRFKDYLREVDRVKVMGRDQPLTLYAWDKAYAKQKQKNHRLPYEQALIAYRQGDWETAKGILARGRAQDPLCSALLERLQATNQVPEHWQGVWSLDK